MRRRGWGRGRGAAGWVTVTALGAWLLLLLPPLRAQDIKNEDGPEVRVAQGWLRGQLVLGAAGTGLKYAAFRGVPYAQPPVGPLRFKAPRPATEWEGVRDATAEGPPCPQGHPELGEGIRGEEDCLYLNVYSTTINNSSSPAPVLFFMHWGGFYRGSASAIDLGPELLLQHGLVVITVSYRLGPLGFANLDSEGVPGNAGLKDVLAALRWVHENVAQLGGDPQRITVAGHDAGAALAHYLILVPAAAGLARAAILQSGSALAQWAFTEDNVEYATELARRINSVDNSSILLDSKEAVEEVLSNASVEQLLRGYAEMVDARPHRVGFGPFPPSVERRDNATSNQTDEGDDELERVFLPRDPESLVLHRALPSVPVLLGITSLEALLRFCLLKWDLFPEKMAIYNTELHHLLPLNLQPSVDTAALFGVANVTRTPGPPPTFAPELRDIADKVREEYFSGADITNSSQQVVELLSDVSFNADVHRLAIRRVQSAAQPTFLYQFSVEEEYNLGRARRRVDRPGAVHTDEMGYLWRVEGLGQNSTAVSPAALTLRRLTAMWSNFVKTANPVPETSELLPVEWPPTSEDTLPEQTFLDIGEKLELRVASLGGKHMAFWRTVYKNLRNGGGL